jgi:hypothetical protein
MWNLPYVVRNFIAKEKRDMRLKNVPYSNVCRHVNAGVNEGRHHKIQWNIKW